MMKTLQEEAISQLVLARLNGDMRTCGQTIDVTVVDGEIILIGTCDSHDQRAVAIMIATGTVGVRRVVDKLRVRCVAQAI